MENVTSKLVKLGIPLEYAVDWVAMGLTTPASIKQADPDSDQRIREAQAILRNGQPAK